MVLCFPSSNFYNTGLLEKPIRKAKKFTVPTYHHRSTIPSRYSSTAHYPNLSAAYSYKSTSTIAKQNSTGTGTPKALEISKINGTLSTNRIRSTSNFNSVSSSRPNGFVPASSLKISDKSDILNHNHSTPQSNPIVSPKAPVKSLITSRYVAPFATYLQSSVIHNTRNKYID